jgi:hypothetical protein
MTIKASAGSLRHRVDQHLRQLEAERIGEPELERAFLARLGVPLEFSPKALEASFGLRDLGCIQYNRRLMERLADKETFRKVSL